MSTVTTSFSVSPMLPALVAQLLGEPAGQQPAERLALLLAVDDRLVQHAQPAQRPAVAGARLLRQLEEELLDRVVDRGRAWCAARAAIALIGRPSATCCSSSSSSVGEPAVAGDRRARAPRRSWGRASSRRSRPRGPRGRAGRPRRRGPSAGTRSRRRPRRAARSAYSGSSYCDRTTTPVPGVALAQLLGRVDALVLEVGGIRMSVTSTCGAAASAPATSSS